jgi:UDP-N-acetylglucosamine 2-epimerase
MLDRENSWENPFGDGKAARRIVDIIEREVEQ